MALNTSGVMSLIAGAVLLVGSWYYGFFQYSTGFWESIAAFGVLGVLLGGAIWIGIILFVLGLLILLI